MVSCGQRGIFVSGEAGNCCGEGVKLIDKGKRNNSNYELRIKRCS